MAVLVRISKVVNKIIKWYKEEVKYLINGTNNGK